MRPDYGDESITDSLLLSTTRPVAKKEHACTGCRNTIEVGQRYRRRFGLVDGEPAVEKLCDDCLAAHLGG